VLGSVWAAPAVYGALLATAIVRGHVGPLPPDALVAPVLFYVCLYVAAAAGLMLWSTRAARTAAPERDALPPPVWYRVATVVVFAASVAGAAFAWRAGPATEDDLAAAWFVTALQLVSILPVVLVSLATLRYGRFDAVVLRGTAYASVLAVVFAVVAGGAALIRAVAPGRIGPTALGVFVVVVLVVAERAAPALRRRFTRAFESDRDRARRRLDAFGERIRSLVDPDALARAAAQAVGEAFAPRSAIVFLRAGLGGPDERWASATYRPERPHFSTADLDRVWDSVREGGRVWADSDELCEAALPEGDEARLRAIGVALAVPITNGDDAHRATAAGLVALGPTTRRGVYTTDDVERLRLLGVQLALAVERLALIERETTLVRQTAEAELVALRAQINPHFLFNALNTVAALIAEQPHEAEATVESLAGLFRDVLTASGRPDVPLRDELRLVGRYLAVEQARFGDALAVRVDATPEALDRPLPAFAVQTLVENAVKHGVERRRGGGAVSVDAHVDADGALVVAVSDSGVGIPALFAPSAVPGEAPHAPEAFHGVGLGNVAARLRGLYGTSDGLRIASTAEGTVATLTLPPRSAEAPGG
ncbi:MAG TPA: histidine kinase, partial [Rubricoccaceae bacterium]